MESTANTREWTRINVFYWRILASIRGVKMFFDLQHLVAQYTFISTLTQLIAQFKSLDYSKKNIEKCLMEISTITSRGMVCLNQLIVLQKEKGVFNIENYMRKELICDMEKFRNILKSFKYSVQFYDEVTLKNT